MNVLFLSLLYPKDIMTEVEKNVKDKIQNQINTVEHALCSGLSGCLNFNEELRIVNALPVGVFPKSYRKMVIPSGWHDEQSVYELGCINLPYLKQKMRQKRAEKAIMEWAAESKENRTVLLYTVYFPYLEAVLEAKKHFPDLQACVLVTDLPNQYGLPSGRTGILKKIEYGLGKKTLCAASRMDAYILMTKHMAEPLKLTGQPIMILEGIIQPDILESEAMDIVKEKPDSDKPVVLYTGTLEHELGIGDLLLAFKRYEKAELWICGTGNMQDEVADVAKHSQNIRYFGRVSHAKAIAMQQQADLLINPRKPDHAYTKYSFPSKTLEYMLSGTPILCYRLEGIPSEYDEYLHYMEAAEGIQGMINGIDSMLFVKTKEERETLGRKQREFVVTNKNAQVQCKRISDFLRFMHC